jgi:hypothetical protein
MRIQPEPGIFTDLASLAAAGADLAPEQYLSSMASRIGRRWAGASPGWPAKDGSGRCPACGQKIRFRLDGLIGSHKIDGSQCRGMRNAPAEPIALASWLPVCAGLTPHGRRHGHQTWLDHMGIRYVLQSERMGHEVPGMRGVYSHITPGMRAELIAGLHELWEGSLSERDQRSPSSAVAAFDDLPVPYRHAPAVTGPVKIGSQTAPRIGHPARRNRPATL